MKTLSLPSSRPGIRFVLYPDHEALHIADELRHLELVGARIPFGSQAPPPSPSPWIETCTAETGFRLVTMSMDGLLVGFAAGTVRDGLIDLRHLVLVATVRTRHPDLVGLLAQTFVEAAELPWADVVIPRGCPALGHLLQEGWRPQVRTGAAVAAAGDLGESLRLTAGAGR